MTDSSAERLRLLALAQQNVMREVLGFRIKHPNEDAAAVNIKDREQRILLNLALSGVQPDEARERILAIGRDQFLAHYDRG